jgi:prevent-host-death family protein
MTDVGVRELKQHLSAFLDRAAAGEVIRVTDRGAPKAVLGPLPKRLDVERGVAEGWLSPGSGRRLRPARPVEGAATVREVLAEDRGA